MQINRRKITLAVSVLLSLYVLSFLLLPVELQVYFDKSAVAPEEAVHIIPVLHWTTQVVDLGARLKDLQARVGPDKAREWIGADIRLVENKFRIDTKTLNIIAVLYDLRNRNGTGDKNISDVRFTFVSIPAVNNEFYAFFYRPLSNLQGKFVSR